MVTWHPITPEEAGHKWDDHLLQFPDHIIYQSLAWGKYRQHFGWSVHHFLARNESGQVVTLVQGLLKTKPMGIGIFWVPGGPVGDLAHCHAAFRSLVRETLGCKRLCIRIRPHIPHSRIDWDQLKTLGWIDARVKLTSGNSMILRLCDNETTLMEGLSKNWRHNLKRASKYPLTIEPWEAPDCESLAQLYQRMESYKSIPEQFSAPQLAALFQELKEQITIYRCLNEQGSLIGIRACVTQGHKAWDLLAAVDEEGRKQYASYALFWKLVTDCASKGSTEYDLCGVDAKNNPGVYNFKKGTGAQPTTYLGEVEDCPSWLVRQLINHKMKQLGGVT